MVFCNDPLRPLPFCAFCVSNRCKVTTIFAVDQIISTIFLVEMYFFSVRTVYD